MTKEEFIDYIIERYKGFENKGRINIFNCCPEIDCDYCPFESRDCTNGIAMSLLDRLVKAEEKKETNFDHYTKNYFVTTYENKVTFNLKEGWKESFENFDIDDFREWLKLPYEEPPKPKFKLTKFEYDLLDAFGNIYVSRKRKLQTASITNFTSLEIMQDKGYFKDIPTDVPIRDVLANCEVIDNECDD